LDTLPYNAHTTGSDALWAGLPMVTCTGDAFAGRVGASLLHAVGLPELVTRTSEDYEALALRLARDPALLAQIRGQLSANRLTQPLFDSARMTRHLERAYATMCERHRRGEPPAGFAVEAITLAWAPGAVSAAASRAPRAARRRSRLRSSARRPRGATAPHPCCRAWQRD